MFGNSSPDQKAGALNQILATLGPLRRRPLPAARWAACWRRGRHRSTPDQASQLSPAQVTEIAAHAEQAHPGVVDQLSQVYAQHSGLIKTLGSAALMVALAKMKEHATDRG